MTRVLLVALAIAAVSVPAASARAGKLTPAEEQWAKPVVAIMNGIAKSANDVQKEVGDRAVLTTGSKAQLRLTVSLASLVACTPKLKKTGAAPTARLKVVASGMSAACTYYGSGAHLLARGIGKVRAGEAAAAVSLIKQAAGRLTLAAATLRQAEARLLVLGR